MSWRDLAIRTAPSMVALSSIKGIGPVALEKICAAFSTIGEMHDAASQARETGPKGTPFNARIVAALSDVSAMQNAIDTAWFDIEDVEREGGVILVPGEAAYPEMLIGLDRAAPIIRVYGTLPDASDASVACVGTRYPNRFGAAVSAKAAAWLVESGAVIVSGMADGVDKICHDKSIEACTPTIAVLGCGFTALREQERVYALDIVGSGGAVVSQFRSGEAVSVGNLLARNEVVAGFAHGMFCMQGSRQTGGTRKAMSDMVKQGKPVFVPVPPAGYEDPDRDVLVEVVREKREQEKYQDISFLLTGSHDFPMALERIRREIPERREILTFPGDHHTPARPMMSL